MDWRYGPFLLTVLVATLMLLAIPRVSQPHDHWINQGGFRNKAGDWCCGARDCFVIPARQVSARADGYHIFFRSQGAAVEAPDALTRFEVVPLNEAQPSLDGAYWRCKRPDGSRLCFFAPKANS